MSLFDFNTSAMRPSDGAMTQRYVEIAPDGGNLSGQMQFRFSSSASQWWIPAMTYMELRFAVSKTGGAAIVAGDNVTTVIAPGDCAFSSCNHTINGVQCGNSTDPAIAGIMLKRGFMTSTKRTTLGDLQNLNTVAFTGTELYTHFVPPLGLYNTGASICGGQHVLTTQLHTDLIDRLFSANKATVTTATLISAKLFVCHVSPVDPIRPPPSAVINTLDMATSSQAMNVNGSVTFNYSVPPSTRKIFVGSTVLNLASSLGPNRFTPLITNGPQVDYAGQSVPARDYVAADEKRKFVDVHASKVMSSLEPFETPTEYAQTPFTLHSFGKSPDDHSTSAQVRLSGNGATTPELIHVGALHSNAIVLQYGGDGLIQNVSYSVVL